MKTIETGTNTLTVGLGRRSYPIHFCDMDHCFQVIEKWLVENFKGQKVAMISDDWVFHLYGSQLKNQINKVKSCCQMVFPRGENSKNITTAENIYHFLTFEKIRRNDLIIALGGGVVGDLAGFCAATFLRGIDYIQIPTTLLAQVDSSVGGKTGINLGQGKNLVGAFYQPRAVLISPGFLTTLEDRDFNAGLAEVIKYGSILDRGLFEFLEKNSQDIIARHFLSLKTITKKCCQLKAQVVKEDEREKGVRAILNFGHTLGHAIEMAGGQNTEVVTESCNGVVHGEAIAMGMVAALEISEKLGLCHSSHLDRLINLLKRFNLPVDWRQISQQSIITGINKDKKWLSGQITFIAMKDIGHYQIIKMNMDKLKKLLASIW